MREKIIEDFTTFIRGTCFTSSGIQSMPMWAHYGNNHRGFCVSYDVESNPDLLIGVFPIQYTDKRLDVTSMIKKHALKICKLIDANITVGKKATIYDDLSIIYMALLMYNVKHQSWSYEKEYRCTAPYNAPGMPYINAKPEKIFIGINCKEKNVSALKDIADYWGIPIYQMELDDNCDRYELTAKEVFK